MKNDDILRSWKEISAYLECDRRTCLRWEKSLGLPIHRMEGSEKGGVFAYREELDKWLVGRSGQAEPAKPETEIVEAGRKWVRLETRRWSRKRLIAFHLSLWALIIIAFVTLNGRSSPRVPIDFRIDGSELAVLGEGGRELFRYKTGVKDLLDTEAYRQSLKGSAELGMSGKRLPYIGFHDIDLDGRRETLFTVQTADEVGEGEIVCLDTRGNKRWSFKAGRELSFGGQVFSSDYRICGFDLNDIDGDGKPEIQFYATHKPDWPCQFIVLSAEGRLLGEFWNSGYIGDFAFADLNADGRTEMALCGVNNEYGQGIVAVFDAADIQGASPQADPKYRCDQLKPGSEKFYLRLPRTDADITLHPVEAINSVFVNQARELSFRASLSGLFFEFDFGMDLHRVRNSHQFIQIHKAAVEAGRVTSVLNEDYLKSLGSKVLYWDGAAIEWTGRNAMANKW